MSNTAGILSQALQQGLFALPSLLIYLIALGLALVNLSRHPRPAWFTLIGSGLLLVSNIAFLILRVYLFANQGQGGLDLVRMMQVIGFVDVAADFFGLLMLVSAIFLDRLPAHGALPPYTAPLTQNSPQPPFHSS